MSDDDEPMREVTITYLPAGRDTEVLDEAIMTAALKALGCTCEDGADENCKAGEWIGSSHPVAELYLFAEVIDAGGGEIRLLVDRDTESYPAPGDRVYVEVR
jgi:hypothetical protein